MSLEDALGAIDPQNVMDDVIRQGAPSLVPPSGPISGQDMMDRMIRQNVYAPKPQPKQAAPDDLSKFGRDPTAPADLAKFGRDPEAAGPPAPETPPPDGGAGRVSVGARSLLQGAAEGVGSAMQMPSKIPAMSEGMENPAQRNPATGAVPIVDPTMPVAPVDGDTTTPPAPLRNRPQDLPPQQYPSFKAGQGVKDWADKLVTPKEQKDYPYTSGIARAVGGMAPAVVVGAATTALLGPEIGGPLGTAIAASTMGAQSASEEYDRAASVIDDRIAKAKKDGDTALADKLDASKFQIAGQAAALSGEFNTAAGVFPAHAILRPVEQMAPGLVGRAWATLDHAAKSGVTFAGIGEAQEYVGQQLAQSYDPKAHYEFDYKRLLTNLGAGAILGGAPAAVARRPGAAGDQAKPGDQTQPDTGTPPGPGPTPDADASAKAEAAGKAARDAAGAFHIDPTASDEDVMRQTGMPDALFAEMSAADRKTLADEIRRQFAEQQATADHPGGGLKNEPPPPGKPGEEDDVSFFDAGDIPPDQKPEPGHYYTWKSTKDDQRYYMDSDGKVSRDPPPNTRRYTQEERDQASEAFKRQGGAYSEPPDPTDPNSQSFEQRARDFALKREAARAQARQDEAARQRAETTPEERLRSKMETVAAHYGEHDADEIKSWSAEKLKDYVTQKTSKKADDDTILKRAGVPPEEAAAMSPQAKKATAEEARSYGVHAGEEPVQEGSREAPIDVKSAEDVARAAAAADQDHSPAQGEANNRELGHMRWQGLDISIEAPAGGVRRGLDPQGQPWETTHSVPYGYIRNTTGGDGMHVDAFMGPNPESPVVYVMDEKDEGTGQFRQHKAFIGFHSPLEAIQAYLGTSTKRPEHIGGMRMMPVEEFKAWLKEGDTKAPISEAMGEPNVDKQVNNDSQAADDTDISPELHRAAVEGALRSGGIDPDSVEPADIDRAAKIHAEEGAPADEAFQVAVVRGLVDDGKISPEDARKVLGDGAEAVLGTGDRSGGKPPVEASGAAAGGTATKKPGKLGAGGAQSGEKPSGGRGRGAEGAKTAEAAKPVRTVEAGKSDTGNATGAADGRAAAVNAGGRKPGAANPEKPAGAKPESGNGGAEHQAAPDAAGAAVKGTKAVAQRIVNAEEGFKRTLMEIGGVDEQGAERAMEAFRKAKVIKVDPIGGRMTVKDGRFMERDVIRRAAREESPTETAAPEKAPKEKSLLQFLASRGGIRSDDPLVRDLQSILGRNNHFVPGHGALIRKAKQLSTADRMGGKHAPMSLDKAREAAVEAGYVHDIGFLTDKQATSTVRTLLDHIEDEVRGNKQYPAGREPEAGQSESETASQEARTEDLAKAGTKLAAALKKVKYPIEQVVPEDLKRATELMVDHGMDPLDAFERAVMVGEQEEGMVEPYDSDYIDLEDLGHAPERSPAHAKGETPAEQSAGRAEGGAPEVSAEGRGARGTGQSAGGGPESVSAEPTERGFAETERDLFSSEPGAEGKSQSIIPGTERISSAELAKRRAAEPLKPKKAQRPADEGLFGDRSNQLDLVDMAAKPPPEKPPSPPAKKAPDAGLFDSEAAPPAAKPAPAAAGKIEDFGEKIGGARKDVASKVGPRAPKEAEKTDDRPTWAKRYSIREVSVFEPGGAKQKWHIFDDRKDEPVRDPNARWRPLDLESREAAEKMLPLVAVSRKHRVISKGDQFAIARDVTDRKRAVIKDGFGTREEATRYLHDHATDILETKTGFGEEILAAPDKTVREGIERRKTDADEKMFSDTFGFRGVEFGNWNNQAERREVMNHAFDGLMDLADILNVPPKALSLGGDLAIAFGARGHGLAGARAHYERDYGVINLTKMSGAGSLAHEWLHAFDHYLGRMDTKSAGIVGDRIRNERGDLVFNAAGRDEDYLSHRTLEHSRLRDELRKALKNVFDTIRTKAESYVEDTVKAEKFLTQSRDRLRQQLDEIRSELAKKREYGTRFVAPATAEQLARFDALAEKLTDGQNLDVKHIIVPGANPRSFGKGRWTNDTVEALSALNKEVRGRAGFHEGQGPMDRLVGAVQTYKKRIDLMNEASSQSSKTRLIPTEYVREARKIDEGRASDYWSTQHELAARAFSAYIEDKVAERGNRSEFLSYGSDNAFYRILNARPFPEGDERKAIDAAFDKLFATLKTQEGEKPGSVGFAEQAPAFYSVVAKTIETAKQEKASPNHWLGTLKNAPGVKPEELEWLGLPEWLRDHKGPVTKGEIADYVRAHQVEVQEVHKGGRQLSTDIDQWTHGEPEILVDEGVTRTPLTLPGIAEAGTGIDAYHDPFGQLKGYGIFHRGTVIADEVVSTFEQAARVLGDYMGGDEVGGSKYSEHSLPGGKNYREMLLTLPRGPQPGAQAKIQQQMRALEAARRDRVIDAAPFNERMDELDTELERLMRGREGEGQPEFKSSHWDEPNVLAHVRFDDRTIEGKRALHIAEIQSDWHQAGRRRGYQGDKPAQTRAKEIERQLDAWLDEAPDGIGQAERVEWAKAKHPEFAVLAKELIDNQPAESREKNTVPDAPFKTTWPELALKRMVRYAAENGYDTLSWDSGDTNADRYDLSRVISRLRWYENSNGAIKLEGDQKDRGVALDWSGPHDALSDVVGKDVADKIISRTGERPREEDEKEYTHVGELSGLDLKVGGEGMRAFYDKMLPAAANKLGKKFGAKVGWGELVHEGDEEAFRRAERSGDSEAIANAAGLKRTAVHALDITPELRHAAVNQGFALFEGARDLKPPALAPGHRPILPSTIPAQTIGPFRRQPHGPIARQAQDYVLAQGRATGNEHLVAIDDKGNVAGTSGGVSNFVKLPQHLDEAIQDPKQAIVVHHNHPSNTGLSSPDIAMLGNPGLAALWAHGHGGNVARMALTPEARARLAKLGTPAQVVQGLFKIAEAIRRSIHTVVQDALFQKRVSMDGGIMVVPHAIALALHRAGLVDYRANTDVDHIIDELGLEPYIEKAARAAAGVLNVPGFPPAVRHDRPAQQLRAPGDVGASFERTAGASRRDAPQARADRLGGRVDFPEEKGGQLRLLEDEPGFADTGPTFTPPGGAGAPPPSVGKATTTAGPRPPRPITSALVKTAPAKAFKNFWASTFQPELVSDRAFAADPLFAKYRAASVQEKDAIYHESEKDWAYWNKRPDSERIRFLDDMETAGFGALPPDTEQAAMARRYRTMLDANWAEEKKYGSQAAFVEDYFPHVWEKPSEWESYAATKTAQLGPTWFQKKRTIDYITDGLAAGMKLKFTNPTDIVTHRLLSGVDMRQRMQLLQDLKRMGLAWEGAQGGDHLVRRGWRAINAPDRKQWVIAPDVQLLWKNAVEAKGLWQAEHVGGSLFRGWMALKNVWVPVKLALSAFHPLHVLHINYSDGMARAFGDVMQGKDPIGALRSLGQGFVGPMSAAPGASTGAIAGALLGSATPIGPYWGGLAGAFTGAAAYGAAKRIWMPAVPHLGATARKAWTKRPSAQTPADRANVALMTEGGFVPQLAEQQKIAAARQLAVAWQRVLRKEAGVSDWRKLITSSLRRPIEALQKPIFEEWIPNVKTAAYLHEAAAVLRRNPELLNDDTARGIALRGVAQQIDARFGEKFYGSMFWNRYLKDTAIGSFLSLGWNQGFVHQFGGAAMQAVTKPLGLLPSFKPSPGRVTRRKATNAITFALAYLGSAALINGLMTLAYTGEQPSGLDFAFARTGGLNPDGTPRRLANMFYLREGWMLAKHIEERGGNVLSGAYEMFTNKLMFEPFKELLNNRDYYGYNIYDENAPIYRQMWQAFQHTMGEQTNPMSISGAKHAAELSAKPFPTFAESIADPSRLFESLTAKGVGESVMGFGPAPGYLEKTAIQNRIGYLYGEHVAPAEKTYDEGLKSPDKMSARTAIMVARQNHDQNALSEANARGRAAGLSQTYMNNLAKVPTDIYLFSRLPDADQKAILRDASPDEYKRYFSKAKQTVKNDIYRARGAGAAVSP